MSRGFAHSFGDPVAVDEHLVQTGLHDPGAGGVDEGTAGQHIFDAVGEAGADTDVFKFVAVDPFGEGAFQLLVDEVFVGGVGGMNRDPAHPGDAEDDARAFFDASGFLDDADGRKGRGQQLQRILALVKCEDLFYRRVDYDAPDEYRHCFQSKRKCLAS